MNKYFDYAATVPLSDFSNISYLLEEYKEQPSMFGNPSCTHELGFKSSKWLQKSRKIIAHILNCSPEEIIFTSGGSESDNMAIKGIMLKYKPSEAEMITSQIEHPAVLNTCRQLEKWGYIIKYIKPNKYGTINPEDIEKEVNSKTKLISIMAINNELGTLEPIYSIAHLAHTHGITFHTDAVQSVGNIDLNLSTIDMASFSGHKFGGLKGTGFLYKKNYIELEPLICGGGQENNYRSGTENVLGNYIMAESLQNYYNKWNVEAIPTMFSETEKFVKDLQFEFKENIIINSPSNRVPNIINVAFKYIDSETLQLMLSNKGYMVSTGSACHSGSNTPSHVLTAIGVPKEFEHGALRISLSPDIRYNELDNLKDEIIFHVKYLLNKEEKNGN